MAEYIDREALICYLNDIWLTATPTEFTPENDKQLAIVRCMGLNDAMDAAKDAPAADVEPMRHGKWIWDKNGMDWGIGAWRCSECKAMSPMWWNADQTNPRTKTGHRYCPNCGAKMEDGDGE